MGDRGNIAIVQDAKREEQVWLYSHWGGYELPERLQKAIAKRERWDDETYLARIIICHAIQDIGERWEETTGYGISTRICDNEYPILVVDCPKQRIFAIADGALVGGRVPPEYEPSKSVTFDGYATMTKNQLGRFRDEYSTEETHSNA